MSLFGAACSYLLKGFAPALPWLFVGRILSGDHRRELLAAGAYIADVTPPAKRAAQLPVGAVFGPRFILGPALGGLLGDVGLRLPYFVAAGLNLANMVYGIFRCCPNRSNARTAGPSRLPAPIRSAHSALARHALVRRLTATMMCSFMAQWIMQSIWALYTQARFGWALHDVGLSLMVVGVSTAVVQGVLVRAIVPLAGRAPIASRRARDGDSGPGVSRVGEQRSAHARRHRPTRPRRPRGAFRAGSHFARSRVVRTGRASRIAQ